MTIPEQAEKLVDDLICAARDHEKAQSYETKYTAPELEAERKKVIAALVGVQWQPIETKPTAAVQVEFYYGNAVLKNQHGEITELPAYRDERRELGYWDGEDWHHGGTGHYVFEFGDENPEWMPTHWRQLPPAPQPLVAEERQP